MLGLLSHKQTGLAVCGHHHNILWKDLSMAACRSFKPVMALSMAMHSKMSLKFQREDHISAVCVYILFLPFTYIVYSVIRSEHCLLREHARHDLSDFHRTLLSLHLLYGESGVEWGLEGGTGTLLLSRSVKPGFDLTLTKWFAHHLRPGSKTFFLLGFSSNSNAALESLHIRCILAL